MNDIKRGDRMVLPKMDVNNEIAIITFNNPPANALNSKIVGEIDQLLNKIESDSNIRAVILHSEGRFFSAGADIKEFTELDGKSGAEELGRKGQEVFNRIETFSKPVIAAIHGAALGGGLELALSCHIRLSTKDAKLGLPELQLGLIPGYGGTQRLPRIVGQAHAVEMILSAEPINGETAHAIGLVTKVVDEANLVDEAIQFAQKLASKSPASTKAALQLIHQAIALPEDEGFLNERQAFSEVFETADAKEGIQAFIEKRKPNFS